MLGPRPVFFGTDEAIRTSNLVRGLATAIGNLHRINYYKMGVTPFKSLTQSHLASAARQMFTPDQK